MMFITDKISVKDGADYTFVCSRIPFAVSCSKYLPHHEYNLIDLDLVNKMKIPLQKIKVSRYTILGQTVRSVGFISQTIQCVHQGKIAGNIHIQAKVVRNLYEIFDVDCIASSKTYTRLVGQKPPDNVDDEVKDLDDEADVRDEEDSGSIAKDEESTKERTDDNDVKVETTNEKTTKEKGDNNIDCYVQTQHIYQPPPTTYKEWRRMPKFGIRRNVMVYETSPDDYVLDTDSSSEEEDDNNNETEASNEVFETPSHEGETFCQFCFLNGQGIKVTYSHNNMSIECPSMSDVDRRRIHGDVEVDRWLARMYGYNV